MSQLEFAAIVESLDAALERRRAGIGDLGTADTDCFRLVDGAADRVDGLVVEVLGSVAVLQEHVGRYRGSERSLTGVAQWVLDRFPAVRSVYRKRFVADRTSTREDERHRDPEPLLGVRAAPAIVAKENGLRFRIRPYDGYSVGLFLDQRAHRQFVTATLEPGSAVLNAFAYTGGFSVYAAARGAAVDTVDVSRRYLEWAKENFAENGLALEKHRFFADNAVLFLKRAMKRPKRYDLVVLDPPSFSRSKEGVFRVRADLPDLSRMASALLAPGGLLFVSCNHEAWPMEAFEDELAWALDGSALRRVRLPDVPFDFSGSRQPLRAATWRLATAGARS